MDMTHLGKAAPGWVLALLAACGGGGVYASHQVSEANAITRSEAQSFQQQRNRYEDLLERCTESRLRALEKR